MARLVILLSAYNRPKRLARAIESIRAQTFTDWELLILDDASPNPVQKEVIDRFVEKDERISVFYGSALPDEKLKICTFGRLLNIGIETTDSEFLSYATDTIEYYPKRCERLISYLDETAACEFVCNQQTFFRYDAEGKVVEHPMRVELERLIEVQQGPTWLDRLLRANCIDHNSTMERRPIAQEHAWSQDTENWFKIDWDRWIQIAAAGVAFHRLGWLGEIKRSGVDSSGFLHDGNGKSLAEVIDLRSGEEFGLCES